MKEIKTVPRCNVMCLTLNNLSSPQKIGNCILVNEFIASCSQHDGSDPMLNEEYLTSGNLIFNSDLDSEDSKQEDKK